MLDNIGLLANLRLLILKNFDGLNSGLFATMHYVSNILAFTEFFRTTHSFTSFCESSQHDEVLDCIHQ